MVIYRELDNFVSNVVKQEKCTKQEVTNNKLMRTNTWRRHQEEQLHFFWSFTLSVIGYWIWPPFIFFGIVATILKELWDFQSDKHSFSLKDIMYGLVGWGVAILVLV